VSQAAWRRTFVVLLIGSFLAATSYTMVVPFLPLFLPEIGVHAHVETWAGVLFSASYLAGAVVSPYWGALADRYGRRPMMLRAGFGLTLVYLLTGLARSLPELLLLRLAQGVLAGYIPAATALLGSITPEANVGYALSFLSIASATGNIVGPLLGGVLASAFGNRIAFMSAGVVVLPAALLTLAFVEEPAPSGQGTGRSIADDLAAAVGNRALLAVLFLTLLTYFSIMTIEPVLPLYIEELGGGPHLASLLAGVAFSVDAIAAIYFAPRWGRLGDRIGFRPVLLAGLVGGGLGNLAQLLVRSVVGFTLVRFAYGAFFAAVFPALNALVVQTTVPEFRGRAFGLSQSAVQLGTMLGPLVGGAVGASFGIHHIFWLTGLLLLATAAAAVYLPAARGPLPLLPRRSSP